MNCSKLPRCLYRFRTDGTGVAAVEFALILPFLLILLIGMAETTTALNADRKVSQVASSAADLVAQTEAINKSEVLNIMKAADAIMDPYDGTTLKVTIASVGFDDEGNAEVLWSVDQDGNTPTSWVKGQTPPIDIPESIAIAGTTLIVGKTSYIHVPMFASLAQNIFPRASSILLGDTYFLRPRLSTEVTFE
jgi:Flp pilus assembly protein TadG